MVRRVTVYYVVLSVFLVLVSGCRLEAQETQYTTPIESRTVADIESIQTGFRAVSTAVLPSIVRIDVQQQVEQRVNPFEFFFGPEGEEGAPEPFYSSGLGSGVIVTKVDSTYYVLTNSHVVKGSNEIQVTLHDGREYSAELIGEDPRKDAALISFTTADADIFIARLGDSNELQVGDWVLAMGSPFGFQNTVTAGIVSALGRRGPDTNISDFIQTDAAINQGNSGGALVNLRGEVIGINTWISTQTGVNIGLGFAIPINNLKRSINQFIESGEIEYGWLGVSTGSLSKEFSESLGLDSTSGAFISQVFIDSPAEKGGFLSGDVVTKVDGEKIKDSNDLVQIVGDLEVGRKVQFSIIRNAAPQRLTVVIEKRQSQEAIANLNSKLWPGMTVVPITSAMVQRLDIDSSYEGKVFVSSATAKSPAGVAGFRQGDIILEINNKKVNSLVDFYRYLNESDTVNFRFEREDQTLRIGIDKP